MGRKLKMTKEQAQANLDRLYGDVNRYTLLGEYEGSAKKIETKCNECNHVWNPYYNNLMDSRGCPECSRLNKYKTKLILVSDYFKEGFIPSSYNSSMKPIAILSQAGEMATLKAQREKFSSLPLIF